jgi:hypothetical protein
MRAAGAFSYGHCVALPGVSRVRTGWGILFAVVALGVGIGVGLLLSDSKKSPDGWVSVKDYGAEGDGSTDDRKAIQEAFDDAPSGGTVVIPPGTYAIGSELNVNKPLVVYAHGATIKATGGMPYMLRYRAGAEGLDTTRVIGHGIQGLTLDMNNKDRRGDDQVVRGLEVRDTWHSRHSVRVTNAYSNMGIYVGPLSPLSRLRGCYYNELNVEVEGGDEAVPGSIGIQLQGERAENASNANVLVGRVQDFETGLKVGPYTDANVLREFDTTNNVVGMDFTYGRTLGYGLWAEGNREQDVIVRSGAKARLDFQTIQKPPRVDPGGELKLYP